MNFEELIKRIPEIRLTIVSRIEVFTALATLNSELNEMMLDLRFKSEQGEDISQYKESFFNLSNKVISCEQNIALQILGLEKERKQTNDN